jgi:hypothetical protein
VTFVLDVEAASLLTRINTPWVVDGCEWNSDLIRKAIVIDNNDESTEDKPKKKSNSVSNKDNSTKEKTKIKKSDSV